MLCDGDADPDDRDVDVTYTDGKKHTEEGEDPHVVAIDTPLISDVCLVRAAAGSSVQWSLGVDWRARTLCA